MANFSGTPTIGAPPLAVSFTDTSTGSPTAWSWNFGDTYTSTAQNPSHTYTAVNQYTVALTAYNQYGNNTNTKSNYINVGNPPVANFSGTPTIGAPPLAVTFTDSSTNSPTAWSWSFGDTNTSTVQNPSHTYSTRGSYTVALTATNQYGNNTNTKSNYINVGNPPVANFSGTPTTGNKPLSVTFTDSSTNSPTAWSWNFGDSTTSTAQNPSHSYTSAGQVHGGAHRDQPVRQQHQDADQLHHRFRGLHGELGHPRRWHELLRRLHQHPGLRLQLLEGDPGEGRAATTSASKPTP